MLHEWVFDVAGIALALAGALSLANISINVARLWLRVCSLGLRV